MKSSTSHQFSQVPSVAIPRSVFDRSHCYKTTFDSGYLIPFYADEALPGDTFSLNAHLFARLATPIVPIMDNIWLDTFYFAVPLRLLWTNWQHFNGESDAAGYQTNTYTVPQVRLTSSLGNTIQSLGDYFGCPAGNGLPNCDVAAWWHRAYNLIWSEWFRDQNLQAKPALNVGAGPDADTDYPLRKRNKRHDYFTSCLPWPQKGPGVALPLGTSAPVIGNGKALGLFEASHQFGLGTANSSNDMMGYTDGSGANVGDTVSSGTALSYNKAVGVTLNPAVSGMIADLSSATAATINSLRQAFQIQRLLERDARGGTRYTEIIRAHFGVISPDARLQRPEFLGGSSTRMNINPVQQTSASPSTPGGEASGSTPQGYLAAYGLAHDSKGGFTKSFTEHCVIIGLVNVRADLTYQQGLPRMFSRQTRYDFYWPALAHLGEQAVLNKEIYWQGGANAATDELVFGYQERYAEYRYFPSQITGKFRSAATGNLDVWHLAQDFGSLPTLNTTFIEENPPISRVIAVPSEPEIIFDSYVQIKCARPMPVYSVPGLIDHF